MAKKKASKAGRPPLPKDERLAVAMTVRFTEEEKALLERAAEVNAAKIRGFVRDAAIAEARRLLGE